MYREIISTPLEKPPWGAEVLSSDGNLLVAWKNFDFVSAEDDSKYHFALYVPTLGWHGYRWSYRYDVPMKILPVAPNTVWAYTNEERLMRLQIRSNGEASITAEVKSGRLLCANESRCLVREGLSTNICQLHFGEDGQIANKENFQTGVDPCSAHFLPDGTIVIHDRYGVVELSPAGNIVHQARTVNFCHYYRPFILWRDWGNDNCLYYTNAPRQGWGKTSVPQAHQERTGKDGDLKFFAVLGNTCYTAMQYDGAQVALYRSLSESPEHIKCVWEIALGTGNYCIVCHNGLICIASSALYNSKGSYIPENNGFLAWDPATNTFHPDIPRSTYIPRIAAGRIPTIYIPKIPGRIYGSDERYNAA